MENSKLFRNPIAKSAAGFGGVALLVLLWPLLSNIFVGPEYFMPHGHCYLWQPSLLWTHVISDVLIGISYLSISLTLAYLVQQMRVPFHLAFIAFGVFIGACGTTHFMDVWTVWQPYYWVAAAVKVVTAVASLATAIWLFPLFPRARALVQSSELAEERRLKLEATHAQLEEAHRELKVMYEKSKELDQLKTDFFANVSHELRTPLTLILGPTRQLASSPGLNESQYRSLETIENNAQLLLRHVNTLLDLSKLDARKLGLEYSNVDLSALTRVTTGYFEGLARQRNIAFQVETPERLIAQVDSSKLQRVMFNLLANAFKFVPDGGKVTCTLSEKNGHAILAVLDNGPGVSPALRARIFERFSQADGGPTRRYGGTGLGLSIVKEFVELHGGLVSAGESPGGGAMFTVDLPLRTATQDALKTTPEISAESADLAAETLADLKVSVDAPARESTKSSADSTVLVIEDNAQMNDFICNSLREEHNVIRAYNGKEGLEKALAHQSDAIISDLMMPEMSGEQLLTELRKDPVLKNTPVLMLTAKADDELRVKLLRDGAQDFLTKPIILEELRARVGNLVSIKRTRDVLRSELAGSEHSLEILAKDLAARRKEAERERASADAANRSKDEFLMVLSHELRTPLTSIFGWTRMLKTGDLDGETTKRGILAVERNTKALIQMIEDLLDVSRIVAGKLRLDMHILDLAAIVRDTIESIMPTADAKRITLKLDVQSKECQISGDSDRLQQIVWNLLSNAVKFTPKEGRIDVRLAIDGEYGEIEITDTGVGIEPEFVPHLFERFRQADSSTTRNYSGLGLGLALVRHLVELHGGEVSADSPGKGKGSKFTVRLPLVDANQAVIPAKGRRQTGSIYPDLSALKVLVVEDDKDTRDLVTAILSGCKAHVTAVSKAEEAFASFQQNVPDLLVSDIGLPGENGYDLLVRIRKLPVEKGGHVPAIALTALSLESDRQKSLDAGYQKHISKPVDPLQLASNVAAAIRG